MAPQTRTSASSLWWRQAMILAGVLAYFLFFSWDRVKTHFAADDMMNMGMYFGLGPWHALASQVLLWKGFYRPMGAAFYLPLYYRFGLDPAPFQIAILAILAINVYLAFRFAKILGCDDLSAALATLAVSYHAGLTNLQYNIDMIYDVLCFSFFVGALVWYIGIRNQGRFLGRWEMAVFLALDVCALNSKEMALTMPLVVLAYESCCQEGAFRNGKAIRAWARGPGLAVLATAALNALDLYGKVFGRTAMFAYPAYQPVFTLQRFVDFQKASLNDLLGGFGPFGWRAVLMIWAVVTYLAWRRRRPLLRFCWAYMVITPLPIAFLVGRVQGALYIPLAGWAVFAAVTFVDLARAATGFLATEPLFRRFGRTALLSAVVAGCVLFWAYKMRYLKTNLVEPAAAQQGKRTWAVIQQLRALGPHVPPHSQVVFLNDPFTDWDMTFIGMLWFGDRSVHVYNQRLEHLSETELARMDHVFDFRDGKLVQVR